MGQVANFSNNRYITSRNTIVQATRNARVNTKESDIGGTEPMNCMKLRPFRFGEMMGITEAKVSPIMGPHVKQLTNTTPVAGAFNGTPEAGGAEKFKMATDKTKVVFPMKADGGAKFKSAFKKSGATSKKLRKIGKVIGTHIKQQGA